MAIVICCYPGIGATTVAERFPDVVEIEVVGSDKPGDVDRAAQVKALLAEGKSVLIPAWKSVMLELEAAEVGYMVVYPDVGLKSAYQQRWTNNGTSGRDYDFRSKIWANAIVTCAEATGCEHIKLFKEGEYLSDVFEKLRDDIPTVKLDTVEDYKGLLWLIAAGVVEVYHHRSPPGEPTEALRYYVACNDTFMYACSDYTDMDVKDAPIVQEMFKEFGHEGLMAWCAHERAQKPLAALITPKYEEAYKYAEKFYQGDRIYLYMLKPEDGFELTAKRLGGALEYGFFMRDIDKGVEHEQPVFKYMIVKLSHEQYINSVRGAQCVYKLQDDLKLKEMKFAYYNGWSVNLTRERAEGLINAFMLKYGPPVELYELDKIAVRKD